MVDDIKKPSAQTGPAAHHRYNGSIAFTIGNAALFANAVLDYFLGGDDKKASAKSRMVSVVLLTGVNSLMTGYGREPVPKQFERLKQKLASHLELSGAQLREGLVQEFQLGKPQGIKEKLESFIANYPIEVTSAGYALASTGLVRSGLKQLKNPNNKGAGINQVALGGCIIGSALAAISIPERTADQLIRAGRDPDSLFSKLQQRPMMYSRVISVGGNFISGYGAWKEIKYGLSLEKNSAERRHALTLGALSAFATACFITGNFMLGISSKKASGSPEERSEAQQEMIVAAASILAAQPPEMQRPLAEAAVAYLTKQPELRMSDIDPKLLTEQVMEAVAKAPKLEMASQRGR